MKNGFTLIELLIVIGIMSIMMAIAIPNVVRLREIYITKGEMQRIISFFNASRSAALKFNDQIGIEVPTGKGAVLRMYRDDGSGGGTARDKQRTAGEQVIQTMTLHPDFDVPATSNTSSIMTNGTINFGMPPTGVPIGTASLLNIIFKYGDRTWRKMIISANGRIRIERSADGTNWSK